MTDLSSIHLRGFLEQTMGKQRPTYRQYTDRESKLEVSINSLPLRAQGIPLKRNLPGEHCFLNQINKVHMSSEILKQHA